MKREWRIIKFFLNWLGILTFIIQDFNLVMNETADIYEIRKMEPVLPVGDASGEVFRVSLVWGDFILQFARLPLIKVRVREGVAWIEVVEGKFA